MLVFDANKKLELGLFVSVWFTGAVKNVVKVS